MKICRLIISLIYATFLIKNVESVNQHGERKQLYKTFDEIYGKAWNDESNDSKDLNCRHVKEEVQDGQAPITSDQKNIEAEILKQKFDEIYAENWSEDEDNSAPDQDESVDKQQNDSNECEKIESDQQKWEIIQKFREMKEDYTKNIEYSKNEWNQIEAKISNGLGVSRYKLYKWIKELGLKKEIKSKFSELEKRQILKKFDEIKSKCKKTKLKNILMNELDEKIAKKLGVSTATIIRWKRNFGLSVSTQRFSKATKIGILKKYAKIKGKNPKTSNLKQFDEIKNKCKKAKLKNILMSELDGKIAKKLGVSTATIIVWKRKFGVSVSNKISDVTKIGILKKYAKIKGKNPKMSDCDIANLLKISSASLYKWKTQFGEEIKNL